MSIPRKYTRTRAKLKARLLPPEEAAERLANASEVMFWMDPPALLAVAADGEEVWVEDCTLYTHHYVAPPLPPGLDFTRVAIIRDLCGQVWQMAIGPKPPPGEDWRVHDYDGERIQWRRPHKPRLPKKAFGSGDVS